MRFYIIENAETEEVIGCELTKKAAYETAATMGYQRDEIKIDAIDVEVSAESIRRLLGNLGGYVK